jgi:hypothetical protein
MVKLDVDTLVTVPADPPWAGPDRALDPLDLGPPGKPLGSAVCPAVVCGDVGVVEEDVVEQPESPITAHISAAATLHPVFLLDSSRRATLGRRARLAMVTEADQSGEDAGR